MKVINVSIGEIYRGWRECHLICNLERLKTFLDGASVPSNRRRRGRPHVTTCVLFFETWLGLRRDEDLIFDFISDCPSPALFYELQRRDERQTILVIVLALANST